MDPEAGLDGSSIHFADETRRGMWNTMDVDEPQLGGVCIGQPQTLQTTQPQHIDYQIEEEGDESDEADHHGQDTREDGQDMQGDGEEDEDEDNEEQGEAGGKVRRNWTRWTPQEHELLVELVNRHGTNRCLSLTAMLRPTATAVSLAPCTPCMTFARFCCMYCRRVEPWSHTARV